MASVMMSLGQLDAFLARKAEDLARLDLTAVLRQCSLLAKADTLLNFQGQQDPDGRPWAPLSPRTRRRPKDRKARKRGGSPMILVDSGVMRGSITAGAGHAENVTPTSMEVGSAVAYARWHMSGTRRMPARPFLGWSARLRRQCEEAVTDFLAAKLGAL